MSDLQTALIAIGACVVAGVLAFNWWQERQFRRRAELAFDHEHDDVLMPAKSPGAEAAPDARIEPRLDGATLPEPAPRAAPLRPSAALPIDPVIDYVVEIELAEPAPVAELHPQLNALAANWGKPVLAAGYDAAAGGWQAGGTGNKDYAQLRFAVQMANRAGCIEQEKLTTFRAAVEKWAEVQAAIAVKSLDAGLAHAMAVQLDRFCADVDIAVGVNVVTRNGGPFSGTKIRALAQAAGMKLESDGVFYLRNDAGQPVYTLDNHEPMPFMPEQITTLTTSGVTFLLDVPRVAEGLAAFEAMLATARSFASTLDGTLVDDNKVPLSDEAIEKIRRQLTGILAKMEAGQIAAGGARALRLFS
jgi:FtsZ-interacting cell division protein ZipA